MAGKEHEIHALESPESKSNGHGFYSFPRDPSPSGVVYTGDCAIVRESTRIPGLVGFALDAIPGLKKPMKRLFERIWREETIELAVQMKEEDLLGDHPLVNLTIVREQVSRTHGSLGGSLFGIHGELDSITKPESKVLFAWTYKDNQTIFSEITLNQFVLKRADGVIPSVKFTFDANKLLYQPFYAYGAFVRRSYGHPNGYLNNALVNALITMPKDQNVWDYIIPRDKQLQQP